MHQSLVSSNFTQTSFKMPHVHLKPGLYYIWEQGGMLPDHGDTLARVSNPSADKGSKVNVATHTQPVGAAPGPRKDTDIKPSRPSSFCEECPLHGCGRVQPHHQRPGPLRGRGQQKARGWEVDYPERHTIRPVQPLSVLHYPGRPAGVGWTRPSEVGTNGLVTCTNSTEESHELE